MNEPSDVVLRQAAHWRARLGAADCAPADREAFERWLAADPAHRAAYERVQSADDRLSAALRADPRLRALAQAALDGGEPAAPSSAGSNVGNQAGKRR
jgi:transmembrane sensor